MTYYFAMVIVDKTEEADGRDGVLKEVDRLLKPYLKGKVAPYKAYLDDLMVQMIFQHLGGQTELSEKASQMWGAQPGDPVGTLLRWAAGFADATDPSGGPSSGQDEQGFFYWSMSNPVGYYDYYSIGGDFNGIIRANRPKLLDRAATARKKAEMEAAGENFIMIKYKSAVGKINERYDPELAKDNFANNTCLVKDLPEDIEAYALFTPDGQCHIQGTPLMFGLSYNDDEKWLAKFTALLAEHSDKLAVGLECHT